MTIIAFDVSKRELVGVRADKNGAVHERFTAPNSRLGIRRVLGPLLERFPGLTVGCEATAEYHRPLASWCLRHNVRFLILNPILTKQFTRATIRKKKTDQTDAQIIARLLAQGEGTAVTAQAMTPLKSANRTATSFMTLATTVAAMNRHLSEIGLRGTTLTRALNESRAALEKNTALLRQYVAGQVDEQIVKLLTSIPGIGETIAPTLIAEIEDIARFSSGKALVAYAGLDPKVKQSGASLHHNTTITKRGSPELRRVAYIAGYIAGKHDPELKAYWEKKQAEGKRYKEVAVATARKLLYRVYAVWKRKTPYEIRCPQPET